MNPYKERLANGESPATLEEVMVGSDIFAGVSVANLVTKKMVKTMADNPIIMAMANPDPEITYEDALSVRDDLIMATGRSDYPNQVNNVLGFPFIFRGALDVRATAINDEMKIAAVKSLAELAKEDVPDSVIKAYGDKPIQFGKEYIIPKPFDSRVLIWEASAVAKAAIETGVAQQPLDDLINLVRPIPYKLVHPIHQIPLAQGLSHPRLLGSNVLLFPIPLQLVSVHGTMVRHRD